ncbi:hypothetical protein UFOVP1437_27 [uncultured Caudovirales phage]|uniref:Uncharacterized protein n=1 Tax=uncultured Caudovirales phage TaxID=2100421 RepID=A0A6J5SE91_9CAUD|nr:hypothetical protein UFOVP1437_27 [uncultured Caudovirales phage]CAB5228143.1 hypothetical protein UFOVP1531_37 [uncultured Caudovirales phage]
MGKVVDIEDAMYLKAINSLPKEYSIDIKRDVGSVSALSEWDEIITWEVSAPSLDNIIGDTLVFNHLLTILHFLIENNEEFKEQVISYFCEELNLEVIDNDSNFNQ